LQLGHDFSPKKMATGVDNCFKLIDAIAFNAQDLIAKTDLIEIPKGSAVAIAVDETEEFEAITDADLIKQLEALQQKLPEHEIPEEYLRATVCDNSIADFELLRSKLVEFKAFASEIPAFQWRSSKQLKSREIHAELISEFQSLVYIYQQSNADCLPIKDLLKLLRSINAE
jgi:hypothetical protein